MLIKDTEEMWVLQVGRRLCIPEVRDFAAEYAPLIDRQISASNLTVVGPWHFISQWLPRDGKTPFDWRICRPVARPTAYDGSIELRHLEPIVVAARTHLGSLRTLYTQGYAPLIAEIEMSRHVFSGESREVYHDWSGPGSSYQRIAIQFGLAR